MEKWKQFTEEKKKQYFVSTQGRVKSIDKATGEESLRKPSSNKSGRKMITVNETGKRYYVYRLVAEAFIPNPENKPTVNHIRGLDAGDGVDNLEWMTYAEQDEHARQTGLKTPGNTSAIVLDSNGIVIASHDTMTEAFTSYDGRNVYYNKDTQIIGNVVVMKQSYYDKLSEDERFNICFECFQRMMEFAYVVNGQLAGDGGKASEMVNCSRSTVIRHTENKWDVNIKGHTVSRLKNRIGVFNDDTKQEDKIYEKSCHY
ncbi:NUMOD4 domain-containing protein [Bacillus wiedmannii]|uniref:NUMOD4 domain-containing protein n=1 Tax=Bacillus wiedmannii TaxID=1890302 RepID=A0AA95LSB2_9BACI|nr:NUMOD4 domain-containing protein [Bacillus wiedmannii]WHY28116.1 NUMOD4 domain-containing protein [Bacillus wiedmannii]